MKFKLNKKKTTVTIALLTFASFILLVNPVSADWVDTLVGGLASAIVSAVGWILISLMRVLIYLAQYNNFINSPAVTNGWVIARDVANMFFVIILLAISFATILQVESYNYKKWLPKLVLMAVLINFSKTICGLLIDFSQVIMLTFVNSFREVAGGNFTEMLGISHWKDINTPGNIDGWEMAAAYVLAALFAIIALIVIAAMTGMLAMRIIMIWVYVVLSPFAYLLAAFPGGAKYASQWWSDFTKNLIVGPVLAFFIWLSFASMVDISDTTSKWSGIKGFAGDAKKDQAVCKMKADGSSCEFGTSELMLKFIISIGMLIGGMKITQEIGGTAGGMAGKIASKGKSLALVGGGAIGGFALARATRGAKNVGMAAINQKGVRGALDTIGSQKGVIGQALRFTGIRGLAREGSLSLGRHKLAVEEKAQKKIDAFKKVGATETLASIASGRAATIGQKAAKKSARKIVVVPEEHFDKRIGHVGLTNPNHKEEAEKRLKALDLKKEAPSLNQVMQLGKSGINLNNVPLFKRMLETNAEARGAYNSGQRDAGLRNYIVGKDRNGRELTGRYRYGVMITGSGDRDEAIGRTGDTTYALRTTEDEPSGDREEKLKQEIAHHRKQVEIGSKKNAYGRFDQKLVTESEQKIGQAEKELADINSKKGSVSMKPGSGALSVNRFARGQNSYLGMDFAKLAPEVKKELYAKLKPGHGLQTVKGLSTKDKGAMNKIAESLVGAIDQEIKSIKSKGKISKSDEKRLNNLQISKKKLKNPGKLKHLELINTSAQGYKNLSDVKETIIHEGMHGMGVEDESETDYLTKKAMSSSPRDRDDIRSGGNKFLEHLENKMDIDRGVNPKIRQRKPVRQILDAEDDDDDYNDYDAYSLRVGSSDAGGEASNVTNVTNVTNVVNSKTADLKEKIKQSFQSAGSGQDGSSFLGFYLKNLTQAVKQLNTNISKGKVAGAMNSPAQKTVLQDDDYQQKKDNNLKI